MLHMNSKEGSLAIEPRAPKQDARSIFAVPDRGEI
jgi:hypothetical protein